MDKSHKEEPLEPNFSSKKVVKTEDVEVVSKDHLSYINRKKTLSQIQDSLLVKNVETENLPSEIKDFYEFWHSPIFKDEDNNTIDLTQEGDATIF